MTETKKKPTKNTSKEKKESQKEIYWIENLSKTIAELVSETKVFGKDTLREVGVRVPGIVAAIVWAVNITLITPYVPAAFGVYAFELIKGLGFEFIWKMIDDPKSKSEYYQSGKLEADIKRLLKKDEEFEKKVAIILRDTQAIQITLNELCNKADEEMISAFLVEIKQYSEIYKVNGESVEKLASSISIQLDVSDNIKKVLREFVTEWKNENKPQIPEPQPSKPNPESTLNPTSSNFPWGTWVLYWILSVLIGAAIIVMVVLYFMGNSESLCLYLSSGTPTSISSSFTPSETRMILNTNTVLFTVTPTLTLTPMIIETVTPTQQLEIPILFSTTGTDIKDKSRHPLPANTMVRVRQSFYNNTNCESLVYYDGRELIVPARALYEDRNCP